mmetsp:Transcript_69403/g.160797  ORF Transcript_69403/g.160797 Transcript_69403/m.160797 type:complete len:296 (+) Transcript_69403:91-978(+)
MGVAAERRAQKKRAQARHVLWLVEQLQETAHHTFRSEGVGEYTARLEMRLEATERTLACVMAELRGWRAWWAQWDEQWCSSAQRDGEGKREMAVQEAATNTETELPGVSATQETTGGALEAQSVSEPEDLQSRCEGEGRLSKEDLRRRVDIGVDDESVRRAILRLPKRPVSNGDWLQVQWVWQRRLPSCWIRVWPNLDAKPYYIDLRTGHSTFSYDEVWAGWTFEDRLSIGHCGDSYGRLSLKGLICMFFRGLNTYVPVPPEQCIHHPHVLPCSPNQPVWISGSILSALSTFQLM